MIFLCGKHSSNRTALLCQKTVAISLPANFSTLNFLGDANPLCVQVIDFCLACGSKIFTQPLIAFKGPNVWRSLTYLPKCLCTKNFTLSYDILVS